MCQTLLVLFILSPNQYLMISITHTKWFLVQDGPLSQNCQSQVFCIHSEFVYESLVTTVSRGCILKFSFLEPCRLRKMHRASDCGTAGIDNRSQHDKLQLPHVFKRTSDAAAVSKSVVPHSTYTSHKYNTIMLSHNC
jgi:hypothetical protein